MILGQKFAGEIDLKFYLNTSHINLMWILYFVTNVVLTIITLREIHKLYLNHNSHGNSILSVILFILQLFTQSLVIMIAISVTKYKLEVDGGVELFPKLFELMSLIVWTTRIATLARIIYALLVICLALSKLGMIIKSEKGNLILKIFFLFSF